MASGRSGTSATLTAPAQAGNTVHTATTMAIRTVR